MKFSPILTGLALAVAAASSSSVIAGKADVYFERVATFPVYYNLSTEAGDVVADETAAEISAVSSDGMFVYYSDSPKERVGLIDITLPSQPQPAGFVALSGEPTSVAVRGNYLLVAVNTSIDFTSPSGSLEVYDITDPAQPTWVKSFDLDGQPDAIAVNTKTPFIAIAIENERDEDWNDGLIPQLPAGHLVSIRAEGDVDDWTLSMIDLTGLADVAPSDPEPEYVAIQDNGFAAVSLQENNHVVVVDLNTNKVVSDFSAGTTTLINVDTIEDDIILPIDTIESRRREPDALGIIDNRYIVTANEGDYEDANGEEGGSRGFTIFDAYGRVKYESGSLLEHLFIMAGHYPESRSENKGIEPESVVAGEFGARDYLFVGSERGNAVAVFTLDGYRPSFHQLLPTTIGPEGLLPVPQRNLLIVSSEEDDAEAGFRSTVSIYQYGAKRAEYPEIISKPDRDNLIPWGALSGMVGDRWNPKTVYAVPDSYYAQSRIYQLDVKHQPAVIKRAIPLLKDGAPVDYDLEGIAQRQNGGFWLASEGNGDSRPNLLIRVSKQGVVEEEVTLPAAVVAKQKSNGFEGVAVVEQGGTEHVVVAFQREWQDDPAGLVRIGVYTPTSGEWVFAYYPLDVAPTDAWVGLSELTYAGDGEFLVIERDNQQGDAAQIKKLYRFKANVMPRPEGEAFPVLEKTLVRDLLPELQATNGWVVDKVEGTALTKDGRLYVVTDNDGVDDASGETRFISLGRLRGK